MADVRESFKLEVAGALTVGTNKDRWVAPFPGEVVLTEAVVGTAPTGSSLILDLRKNGTTIYSTTANRPTVAAGASTVNQPAPKPDVVAFTTNDVFTLDVAQVGSTVAGSDLDVVVEYVTV